MRSTLVVAESDRDQVFAAQRILQELTMTVRTQVVLSAMTVRRLAMRIGFAAAILKHVMKLGKVIDIIFEITKRIFIDRLDFDLHNVSSVMRRVDLAFTTITSVVDHRNLSCSEELSTT
tara:strand:- start:1512 stop:1868 length:357 start_codon:yes stop_codon:yes gene_type:complete